MLLELTIVPVPSSIQDSKGSWFGNSKLNQSWLPLEKRISESASFLHIETDEQNSFATIAYTWHHEQKRHEGTLLVCMDSKTKMVEIGWVDSWHQNTAVMHLVGSESSDGTIKTKGTYKAEAEVWGWTIEFKFADDHLMLKMENVTPKNEAEWAVEAIYKRT